MRYAIATLIALAIGSALQGSDWIFGAEPKKQTKCECAYTDTLKLNPPPCICKVCECGLKKQQEPLWSFGPSNTKTIDGYSPDIKVPEGWQWIKRGNNPWKLEKTDTVAPAVATKPNFRESPVFNPTHRCPSCQYQSPPGQGTWIVRGSTSGGHLHSCPQCGLSGITNCPPSG